jgi:gamma-glutamylcyclotransferase (GGCT)/AIG2-like uncharacterized protein YtfP
MADKNLNLTWTLGNQETPVTSFDYFDETYYLGLEDLQTEMESIVERGEYTTDYPELITKDSHYLFVYGTLRKQFGNHNLLKDQQLVGCGFTNKNSFFMARNKLHGFPVVFFDNREETRAKIYGEVYKVSPEVLLDLDELEANGVMYKRLPLTVDYYQKEGGVKQARCWMYLGIKDFWAEEKRSVSLGVGRKNTPNNGSDPYYYFAKVDEL